MTGPPLRSLLGQRMKPPVPGDPGRPRTAGYPVASMYDLGDSSARWRTPGCKSAVVIEADIDALFTAAGYRGMVSVVEIDGPGHNALRENEQAYAASAFKTTVALELCSQCADGELDPAQHITITPAEHTFGGQGLCLFTDEAEISLRDLARLMLTISDNTATDAVIRHVSAQRITARLRLPGLTRTHVAGTIREHFDAISHELRYADLAEHHQALAAAPESQAAAMRARFPPSLHPPRPGALHQRQRDGPADCDDLARSGRPRAGLRATAHAARSTAADPQNRHRIPRRRHGRRQIRHRTRRGQQRRRRSALPRRAPLRRPT